MAGGYGQRMRLRLFIEGVEVPIIAAQVQVNPNSPAACSIQIPPLAEGTRLLPRSIVHVFFLDFYEVSSPFAAPASPTGANNSNTNQSPTEYEDIQGPNGDAVVPSNGSVGDMQDINNAKYKLLFGGEVVGFQWTKNQTSRSLILQCLDWSSYWDTAQQWNNTDLFGPGIKALFSGGSTNLFTDFLEDEGSAILRIIQTPSIQYPNLKGLMGGIVHLLESIGGSYTQGKTIAGDNIFFSLAELRLHITQMITAYDKDPTASNLLSKGYDSLLGRTLGDLGQQVSMRTAVNALMGIIFHETYAQCCPCYVPASGNTPSGGTRTSILQDPNNAFISTNATGLIQSIAQIQAMLDSTSNDVAQVSIIASLTSMRATCTSTINMISGPTVMAARSYYSSALNFFGTAQANAQRWTPGSNPNIVNAINTALNSAQTQLQKAADFEVVSTAKTNVPARLNQQIFRPDVWFSAPPCCNVIFPEQYHTLNYQRAFLQEPTRLLLKTNDEFFGEDELFDAFYYAPRGFTLKSGGRELQDVLNNGVLDHELFTGILPVFEKMGELNIFGARSGTVAGQVPKVGLAQRSTNFLYAKYRFAARQMSLSGKFNPYLACGFPALVIDKYVNQDTLTQRDQLIQQNGGMSSPEIDKLLGTHFLCNLTEVEHNVDQNHGVTNLNCSYARQPEESIAPLGIVRPGQKVQTRSPQDATRTSVVAAVSPPAPDSMGPSGGVITNVLNVSQAYNGQTLPLYQGPAVAGTKTPSINVTIGLSQSASSYSAAVTTFIGDPTQVVTFQAFKVTETVARYTSQTVDMPMEELIRPGWYGDCWHPSMIGQVYQQFFQTGSICDQQQVDAANTASTGVQSQAAQQALAQAQSATDADDPAANAPGLLTLQQGSSILDAVAFIVTTYSLVKNQGLDVNEYLSTYTWRPIATMFDIFGSSDLTFDSQGESVIQGIEGFHSRAIGPYANLFGLVTPAIENIVGLKRGSTQAQRADKRGVKQAAVQTYVSALQASRAILG